MRAGTVWPFLSLEDPDSWKQWHRVWSCCSRTSRVKEKVVATRLCVLLTAGAQGVGAQRGILSCRRKGDHQVGFLDPTPNSHFCQLLDWHLSGKQTKSSQPALHSMVAPSLCHVFTCFTDTWALSGTSDAP